MAPITHFDPDPSLLEPLLDATQYTPWDAKTYSNPDWPGNILSKRTVIYGDGTIALSGDPVAFSTDPDELDLCRRLVAEVLGLAGELDPGGTGDNHFGPFFSVGGASPNHIDAELIRARFNGTICAWADVEVEPVAETGYWWDQKVAACDGPDDPYLQRWRDMIHWFQSRSEFVGSAIVRIGDNLEMASLPPDAPEDVEAVGVIMPRLIVGITRKGSLAGLSGCAVLT